MLYEVLFTVNLKVTYFLPKNECLTELLFLGSQLLDTEQNSLGALPHEIRLRFQKGMMRSRNSIRGEVLK